MNHQGTKLTKLRHEWEARSITTFEPIRDRIDGVAKQIVDSALAVHRVLGPGLIEPVYERCLCYELSERGLKFGSQVPVPIVDRGVPLDAALRLDARGR